MTPQATSPVTLRSFIKNYVAYNLWANRAVVTWLSPVSDAVLERRVPSSFPSLRETCLHIWHSQQYWLTIVKGATPSASPRHPVFHGTNEDLFEGLLQSSSQFSYYVQTLTEEALQAPCELHTPWLKGSRPCIEFIQHAMNHSTYHRGQLITISHQVAIPAPPMTDYHYYHMMVGQNPIERFLK